jgi:multidrug efflux pump subunit AcrA (membrane-fusion protein)
MSRKNTVTLIIVLIIVFCVLMGGWTVMKGRLAGAVPPSAQRAAQGAGQAGPAGQAGGAGAGAGAQGQAGGAGAQGAQGQAGGAGQTGGAGQAGGAGAQGQAGGAGQAARSAVTVRTVEVALGTIEQSVSVSGDVLAVRQVSIYPQTGGRITELRFRVGDQISQNDVAAKIDPSRPGEVYAASPVVSTISGTVLQAPYSSGDTVGTSSAIYVVGDLSSLVVETDIPERFSTAMRLGLNAAASFEALPGEVFPMAVSEISPVLDPQSRTLRIRAQFRGRPDPRIRAGMYATVSLVTLSRAGVPLIPRVCLINTYGDWIVFTVEKDGGAWRAVRRVVTIGVENEERVEITGGLEAGEVVVSVGQNFLSDGELVRIVE